MNAKLTLWKLKQRYKGPFWDVSPAFDFKSQPIPDLDYSSKGVKVKLLQEPKSFDTLQKDDGKQSLISITTEWLWSRKVQRALYFCVNKWGTAGTQHSAGPDIFVWVYSAVADPAIAPAAKRFKRQDSAGTALGVETYDLLSELPWVHLGILGQFL